MEEARRAPVVRKLSLASACWGPGRLTLPSSGLPLEQRASSCGSRTSLRTAEPALVRCSLSTLARPSPSPDLRAYTPFSRGPSSLGIANASLPSTCSPQDPAVFPNDPQLKVSLLLFFPSPNLLKVEIAQDRQTEKVAWVEAVAGMEVSFSASIPTFSTTVGGGKKATFAAATA